MYLLLGPSPEEGVVEQDLPPEPATFPDADGVEHVAIFTSVAAAQEATHRPDGWSGFDPAHVGPDEAAETAEHLGIRSVVVDPVVALEPHLTLSVSDLRS